VTSTKIRVNKINTVVVPVSDQERAIEFYVERLGFEKRVDVPFGNGDRWVEVAPADAVTMIALAPPPPGTSTGKRETGIGLQTDDIDAYHAELQGERRGRRPRGQPHGRPGAAPVLAARPGRQQPDGRPVARCPTAVGLRVRAEARLACYTRAKVAASTDRTASAIAARAINARTDRAAPWRRCRPCGRTAQGARWPRRWPRAWPARPPAAARDSDDGDDQLDRVAECALCRSRVGPARTSSGTTPTAVGVTPPGHAASPRRRRRPGSEMPSFS